jgi:protein-S-isoprenylcysteine O-methyltransferase Ste14
VNPPSASAAAPGRGQQRLVLLAFLLVGLAATAGKAAFVFWAWPRLPLVDASPAPAGARILDAVLLALFPLHAALFSWGPSVRFLHARLRGCERALAAFTLGILLVVLAAFWEPWNEPGLTGRSSIVWFCRGFFIYGAVLHLTAAAAVGNERLLGFAALRRVLAGRPPAPAPEAPLLLTAGPYSRVRRPDGLAIIILLAAGAPFAPERLLAAAGGAAWMLAIALAEDARLRRAWGAAYEAHRARTGLLWFGPPRRG